MHRTLPFGFASVLLSLLWTGSWNIRCNGSQMKSCLWTEKAWKFEGRCHRLCILPACGKTNPVYFYLTKAWAPPKVFYHSSQAGMFGCLRVPSLGVGCASELTITTDKNTERYRGICHGCLLFRDEMADWKTPWQWFLWCFRRMVICYERRVSIYYIFGECWHKSRGFDVGRCQRFRFNLKQSWAELLFCLSFLHIFSF